MAGGEDLIGPRQSPSGLIIGLEIRAGDTRHRVNGTVPFGPVVGAIDPLTTLVRHFRFGIQIQDNGDGTTSPVIIATELDAEGNVIP